MFRLINTTDYYEKQPPRETAYQGRTFRVIEKVLRNSAVELVEAKGTDSVEQEMAKRLRPFARNYRECAADVRTPYVLPKQTNVGLHPQPAGYSSLKAHCGAATMHRSGVKA